MRATRSISSHKIKFNVFWIDLFFWISTMFSHSVSLFVISMWFAQLNGWIEKKRKEEKDDVESKLFWSKLSVIDIGDKHTNGAMSNVLIHQSYLCYVHCWTIPMPNRSYLLCVTFFKKKNTKIQKYRLHSMTSFSFFYKMILFYSHNNLYLLKLALAGIISFVKSDRFKLPYSICEPMGNPTKKKKQSKHTIRLRIHFCFFAALNSLFFETKATERQKHKSAICFCWTCNLVWVWVLVASMVMSVCIMVMSVHWTFVCIFFQCRIEKTN